MPMNDGCILVTGGNSGLGAAVVDLLVSSGHHVGILSRKAKFRAQGDERKQVCAVDCDVRSEEQVARAFDDVESMLGMRISGLVNSAGIVRREWFSAQPASDWRELVETNLLGTIVVCHEATRRMTRQSTSGSIVNFSSVSALISLERRAVYSATKSAVVQFSRCLALELAPAGIRVNVVCPGAFDTPMLDRTSANADAISWYDKQIPFGRIGKPEECAAVVSFLLGDGSSYVSGAVISVDGAWSVR